MIADTTETELKYYFAGSVRIAMRVDEVITWLLSDHINSTSITVDGAGDLLTTVKYTAFGEIRSGDSTTDYQYTGQRNEVEIGLYYYVARFYDPQLARFISADTIIPEPGSIKGYDRYAYVNYSPINYIDPSGHKPCDSEYGCSGNRYQTTNHANPTAIAFSIVFSFGGQSGSEGGSVGGLFGSISLDFVITGKNSGFFITRKVPTAATESNFPQYYPLALAGPSRDTIKNKSHIVKNAGQMVTLQGGISLQITDLFSDGFTGTLGTVEKYTGPATHTGFTVFGLGGEKTISNDPFTGEANGNIQGDSLVFSIKGIPPIEYHRFVTNSEIIGHSFDTPTWLYSFAFGGYR